MSYRETYTLKCNNMGHLQFSSLELGTTDLETCI